MFLEFLSFILDKIFFFCGSITGDSFPRPLTREEERRYIKAFKENGDKDAKDMLIKHNLRLVAHIVKKYQGTEDNDDLISTGTIGLIKAINSFDPNKGIQLATYTARCIENEILMHLRRVAKIRGEVSFDEPLNVDWEGNELLLSDILGTDGDVVVKQIESTCEKQILKEALTKLNEREKRIMILRFGLTGDKELTQKEVADLMGISQSYISRLEKKIVGKLKKEIKKAENC